MGEWVLRMTMGCEGLLIRALEARPIQSGRSRSHEAEAALKVLKTFAPTCEAAYEDSRKQRATNNVNIRGRQAILSQRLQELAEEGKFQSHVEVPASFPTSGFHGIGRHWAAKTRAEVSKLKSRNFCELLRSLVLFLRHSPLEVPASPVLARCMAELAAELVAHRARRRRRLQATPLGRA